VLATQARLFDGVIKLVIRKFGRAKAGNWHCREKAARYPEVAQFIIRHVVKLVEAGEAAIMVAHIDSVAGGLTNEVYNEIIAHTLAEVWSRFPIARPVIDVRYGQVWEGALRAALASKIIETAQETLGVAPFDEETIKNAQAPRHTSSGLQVTDTVAWVIQRRGDRRFIPYQNMIERVKMNLALRETQ
jgi:hypothetical protein